MFTDDEERDAAAPSGEQLGIELTCLHIGVDVRPSDPEAFRAAFGVGKDGASLVRPDGYVAWRSIDLSPAPLRALTDALGRLSFASRLKRR